MASLEKRGDVYRAKFRYGGKQSGCSLKTSNLKEATSLLGRLEENLRLVERGRLVVPAGADLGVFLLSDGKVSQKPVAEDGLPLSEFFRRYHERRTNGKESNTSYTEKIHTAHFERILDPGLKVRSITSEALQDYVDKRAAETNPRSKQLVSHVTVRKEVGTFAVIWNTFGLKGGYVTGPAPTKGLTYGKTKAKHPFRTMEEIRRIIDRRRLSPAAEKKLSDKERLERAAEEKALWDGLFLGLTEIQALLDHVRDSARSAFVHPMFVFAARTGARRSEIMRSEVEDFDFEAGTVRIREKKKDNSKEMTFRQVPLSPLLAAVMRDWFARHPGGRFTVCERADVPLLPQTAAHHFRWAVEGSKWEVVKGWHVLRHSFASNCAAKGVDQRVISEWMGHMTVEMERRYRHFFPDQQRKALDLVFADG